jgi:hypothetical protein
MNVFKNEASGEYYISQYANSKHARSLDINVFYFFHIPEKNLLKSGIVAISNFSIDGFLAAVNRCQFVECKGHPRRT